jgi:hypothetical protein
VYPILLLLPLAQVEQLEDDRPEQSCQLPLVFLDLPTNQRECVKKKPEIPVKTDPLGHVQHLWTSFVIYLSSSSALYLCQQLRVFQPERSKTDQLPSQLMSAVAPNPHDLPETGPPDPVKENQDWYGLWAPGWSG